MASIRKVTNGNLWLDGNNLIGKIEEVTMPEITSKTSEYAALGMVGTTEYHSGFEKMEITVKVSAYHKDIITILGDPTAIHNLTLRGQIDNHTPTGVTAEPFRIETMASLKQMPLGQFKAHERVTVDLMLSVYSVIHYIDNEEILAFDPQTNIYRVRGVDKLAAYNRNLGN